jgi:hypothetical protein
MRPSMHVVVSVAEGLDSTSCAEPTVIEVPET